MERIKYYKDARYDHNLYDDCYEYYEDSSVDFPFQFDEYQMGYNHLGYDTLELVNIVHNGTEMEYFFLDDDGSLITFTGDDAQYIICNRAGYRMTPQTHNEQVLINYLLQLKANREEYDSIVDEVNIKEFRFLKK